QDRRQQGQPEHLRGRRRRCRRGRRQLDPEPRHRRHLQHPRAHGRWPHRGREPARPRRHPREHLRPRGQWQGRDPLSGPAPTPQKETARNAGRFGIAGCRPAQAACTASACRPFWPWTTVKVTFWPSLRLLKPCIWMARKWTNTSSPFSRLMKPKPLASLNHLTVPVSRSAITATPGTLLGGGYAVATAAGCKEYARWNDEADHHRRTYRITVTLPSAAAPNLPPAHGECNHPRATPIPKENHMDITVLWYLLAGLLVLAGLAGLVLPALPGLPLVFTGMVLAAWVDGFDRVGGWTIAVLGFLTLLSVAADILAGAVGARRYGAGRMAAAGAALGTIVGILFGLPGLLLGPFVGAVLGELWHTRDLPQAARVGVATWIGLLLGAALKVALAFAMLGLFVLAWLF